LILFTEFDKNKEGKHDPKFFIPGGGMTSGRVYEIPGILDKAYEIEHEIMEDLERLGYDENALFSIRLAMDEALINALKHGNRNVPKLTIRIFYEADTHKAKISVEDSGEGFDYHNISDPTIGEHLKKTHGRGVFLIRKFMHEVYFNDKGNQITFVYHNQMPVDGEFKGLGWKVEDNVLVLLIHPAEGPPPVDQWQVQVEKHLNEGRLKVVVNLQGIHYINTTILSFLIGINRMIKQAGGQCRLVGASGQVKRVLETTNIVQLIPMHTTIESARKSLHPSPTQSS
jgi:serine/threonine-protein kinase RsbW